MIKEASEIAGEFSRDVEIFAESRSFVSGVKCVMGRPFAVNRTRASVAFAKLLGPGFQIEVKYRFAVLFTSLTGKHHSSSDRFGDLRRHNAFPNARFIPNTLTVYATLAYYIPTIVLITITM